MDSAKFHLKNAMNETVALVKTKGIRDFIDCSTEPDDDGDDRPRVAGSVIESWAFENRIPGTDPPPGSVECVALSQLFR